MSALQASPLCGPSSLPSLSSRLLLFAPLTRQCNPSPSLSISSSKPLSRRRLQPLISHALPPENASSAMESAFPGQDWVFHLNSLKSQGFAKETGGESIRAELDDVVSGEFRHEEKVFGDSAGKQSVEGRFRLVVFQMGVFATLRNGFEKLVAGKWLGLWPGSGWVCGRFGSRRRNWMVWGYDSS